MVRRKAAKPVNSSANQAFFYFLFLTKFNNLCFNMAVIFYFQKKIQTKTISKFLLGTLAAQLSA